MAKQHTTPFPYFGGKRTIAAAVWQHLGRPKQYIEPFCGGAAVLLAAPAPASLEVIGDQNFYIANFWRCIKYQPDAVYEWQDYPVSHVDIDARHRWLTEPARTLALRNQLSDAAWPGDPKIAGWWVWGQCCWIGDGWCEAGKAGGVGGQGLGVGEEGIGGRKKAHNAKPNGKRPDLTRRGGVVGEADRVGDDRSPHITTPGMGIQAPTAGVANGQKPLVRNGGRGVQSKVIHTTDGGRGVQCRIPRSAERGVGPQAIVRVGGVQAWFQTLADRLARVRIIHGDWTRCLNHHYGAEQTAIFFDPPYKGYEALYGKHGANRLKANGEPLIADAVAAWCLSDEAAGLRIALCGHLGDYDLPGWEVMPWSRRANTYGSKKTKDAEAIWFSPACLGALQTGLF